VKSKSITPRERRHEINRQKILETARKILVSEGLKGLSMRALAEQIDYSPSAIYKYFDDKEDILQAIREDGWQHSIALSLSKVPANLPPPERLLASGKAYLDFAATYPEYYQLMFNSPDLPERGISDISRDPRFAGLIQVLQEGIASGHFKLPKGYTPVSMAFQLWISCHGIAMLRMTRLRDTQAEFDALADQIMRVFINNFTVK
jgi:AcrR family transcriptional regulator